MIPRRAAAEAGPVRRSNPLAAPEHFLGEVSPGNASQVEHGVDMPGTPASASDLSADTALPKSSAFWLVEGGSLRREPWGGRLAGAPTACYRVNSWLDTP